MQLSSALRISSLAPVRPNIALLHHLSRTITSTLLSNSSTKTAYWWESRDFLRWGESPPKTDAPLTSHLSDTSNNTSKKENKCHLRASLERASWSVMKWLSCPIRLTSNLPRVRKRRSSDECLNWNSTGRMNRIVLKQGERPPKKKLAVTWGRSRRFSWTNRLQVSWRRHLGWRVPNSLSLVSLRSPSDRTTNLMRPWGSWTVYHSSRIAWRMIAMTCQNQLKILLFKRCQWNWWTWSQKRWWQRHQLRLSLWAWCFRRFSLLVKN
jgi:hypothetical protein